MAGGEEALIEWLRRSLRRHGMLDFLGDDAAVLPASPGTLVTVDTQIEGVHFYPGLDAGVLARRLLAVNLSDLAAMGARPRWAFLALTAPAGFDHKSFFRAFLRAARAVDLVLAGGDLSHGPRPHAALTLLGEPYGRLLERSAARAGQRLYVGAPLGVSALGQRLLARAHASLGDPWRWRELLPSLPLKLRSTARAAVRRHLEPQPQLALGRHLAVATERGAAIDVSDGLAKDLGRLRAASGVGVRLDVERLPMPAAYQTLAACLGLDWRQLALSGGEDYALAFTLDADAAPPSEAIAIGEVVAGRGLRGADGVAIAAEGFDHLP
jgi:thiamine-monophosphate kinase